MQSPYRIEAPALISFSGGRTSAYMLRMILDAHGGALPDGAHVVFANTGKERPETLDFIGECERRWGVSVVWLEYRHQDGKHGYARVSYETASRRGEPFADLIKARSYLPNPIMRFCTTELKIRVMKKYMVAAGHEEWDSIIGLRADEPMRVHRSKLSCAKEQWTNVMPLAKAGATLGTVMEFWSGQPFDLQLQQHEGNCDLCFLKGREKIDRIILDNPQLAQWWIEQERLIGGTFRIDRPKYAHLLQQVNEQGRLFAEGHEYDTCGCTD